MVSIIIPAFNEAKNIPLLLDRINELVSGSTHTFEIIFVNDGSRDNTHEVLLSLSNPEKHIYYISLSRNFGQQNALRAGYDYCNGDAVICLDADLQNPPEMILKMIAKWEEGYELVLCKRRTFIQHAGFFKSITSKLFYNFLNRLSDVPIEADAPDFRLMDKKLVMALRKMPESDLFLRGIISWMGFKKTTITYEHAKREYGNTNYPFKRMLKLALTAVTGFSTTPLTMAVYIGFFFSSCSIIYIFYAIIRYFEGETISGWASVIVTISLFGGLQLVILGIIGLYLGKTFLQVKGRPSYIVRDTNIGDNLHRDSL